jgi:hypothetical protein
LEFLAKHYEKLILGACLLCLIGGIFLVVNGVTGEQKRLEATFSDANSKVGGNKILPALDLSGLQTVTASLQDSRTRVAITEPVKDAKKGSLLQAKRYILCKNFKCGNLIHVRMDTCIFCGQAQDPYRDLTPEDDTDQDGIPDLEEQRWEFLNHLDPYDAYFDYDGDGFLNIEEYQAKTALDDPDDFPPLAMLMRVIQVAKRKLPFQFSRVRTLDSELKTNWKIEFIVGRSTRLSVKFDEEIVPGYKIIAVNDAKDAVTVETSDGKRYTMPSGELVEEEIPSAHMLYLASRDRNSRKFFLSRRIGEDFFLEKMKAGAPHREFYRVLSGTSRDDLIIGQLDAENGKVIREFKVNPLDPKKDFIPEVEGSGAQRNAREPSFDQPGIFRRRPRR